MDLLLSLELKTKSYSTFSIRFFSPLFWTWCPPYNYVTIEQLTIKTNTRKVSIQKFDRMNFSQFFILENSSTHIEYMSMINRTYFATTFTQFWRLKNIYILKIFFQCHNISWLTSKEEAQCKKNGQNNVSFGQISNIFESWNYLQLHNFKPKYFHKSLKTLKI